MYKIGNVNIVSDSHVLTTLNLKKLVGYELKISIKEKEINQYLKVAEYLINYFEEANPKIIDGHTISYHSWLLKFIIIEGVISINEVKPNGEGFVDGCDNAIEIVEMQSAECYNYNSVAIFPLFSQQIVISKDIFDAQIINAVRYPSPSHMTGWWLTSESFNGDVLTLEIIHYYHLAFKRPDILKYLALPFGFRFHLSTQTNIWFDQEVAKEAIK